MLEPYDPAQSPAIRANFQNETLPPSWQCLSLKSAQSGLLADSTRAKCPEHVAAMVVANGPDATELVCIFELFRLDRIV
jgi:hypothetical protein